MQLKWTLLIIVALSVGARAQEPKSREREQAPEQAKTQQQAVTNDDRGRAFIIGRESPSLSALATHGRAVISEPQQFSIFLGSGWQEAAMRAREPELANLLANVRDQAQLTALDERGVKNLFGAAYSQERLDDFVGNRNVSDLEIQSVLAGMIKDGTLLRPGANTIYVLFLDQGLRSTLGAMIAGKHYAAYHNFFNASGMKIHYVVVPFEADPKTAYQIVLRAFVAAALNPAGFPLP